MLNGFRVAVLVGPGYHHEEATSPKTFLSDRNAVIDFVGLDMSEIPDKSGTHSMVPDASIDSISPDQYDGLLLPGGGAPERIRLDDRALEFVKAFWDTGRPVGAICHGPQILISAGVLDGVKLTCWSGIRDDVRLAGGRYVDQSVCVDGQLITSRQPDDLPEFNETFVSILATGSRRNEVADMDPLRALEIAISREKGAHDFYVHLSQNLDEERIRNKFKYLASVEHDHFDQLFALYERLASGASPTIDEKESEISINVESDIGAEEALDLAISAEDKAYQFYRSAARKANSERAVEMFEYLAAEELEHKRLLSVDRAADRGGRGHFQWATYWDVPPGMDDLW